MIQRQWLNPKDFPVGTIFYVDNGSWWGEVADSEQGPVMLCKSRRGGPVVNEVPLDRVEDDYKVFTSPSYPDYSYTPTTQEVLQAYVAQGGEVGNFHNWLDKIGASAELRPTD